MAAVIFFNNCSLITLHNYHYSLRTLAQQFSGKDSAQSSFADIQISDPQNVDSQIADTNI
jgi:hypothetical protein